MPDFRVRALNRCEWTEVAGLSGRVERWCWAGHTGLMVSADPPPQLVPTGWLWGWSRDHWLRWRIDPRFGCVGAELRHGEPQDGDRIAHLRGDGSGPDLAVRTDSHMLTWAEGSLRPSSLRMITVIDPAPMTFMSAQC